MLGKHPEGQLGEANTRREHKGKTKSFDRKVGICLFSTINRHNTSNFVYRYVKLSKNKKRTSAIQEKNASKFLVETFANKFDVLLDSNQKDSTDGQDFDLMDVDELDHRNRRKHRRDEMDIDLDVTYAKEPKDDDYVPAQSKVQVDRSTKEQFIFNASKSVEVTAVADK